MATSRGHILQYAQSVTLTRRLPVRFDVSAQLVLPAMRKLYLAQQVRQDLWRRFQTQRSFTPVVPVEEHVDGILLRAGGQFESVFCRAY